MGYHAAIQQTNNYEDNDFFHSSQITMNRIQFLKIQKMKC